MGEIIASSKICAFDHLFFDVAAIPRGVGHQVITATSQHTYVGMSSMTLLTYALPDVGLHTSDNRGGGWFPSLRYEAQ